VAQTDNQDTGQGAEARPLSRTTLFYYGLADMPIQMAAVPVAAFVPNYYSQDLGVSLAAVGLILLLSRSFDAITDPLIGWLSDRTNTRWGRRRVWMVGAIPILMLSIYKLFMPEPGEASPLYLFTWLVVLWLGWTMLFIPYYAWAAELSPEYNERSRITGWRSAIGLGANVVSKLVPVVAIFCCAYGGTQETLFLVGSMTLILLPVTVGLTVAMVPEGKDFIPARMPLLPGLALMWRNGPFKRLIAAFFINQLGTSISTALIVFYVRSVLQDDEKTILQLLVYYAFNLCGIPFFVKYSSKVGKHRAWCYALLLFSFFMLGYLLLGAGDFYWMLPITAITGFLAGCFWVIPNSMKADVIDVDRLESGEDRTAWYFAVWSLATKVALSVGPFIALTLLSFTGYNPMPEAGTEEGSTLGLKLLFVFGPATGFLLTALIAWNYPLTEEKHKLLRGELAAARAARR
jgi:Na+/melibiose symporter-like transporter